MKKVLLIQPPFTRLVGLEQDYIPLSLWYISTLLKEQGFEPYIKNLNVGNNLKYVNYADRNAKYSNLMSLYNVFKADYYEELSDTIQVIKPDIIGFTVLTVQIKIVNDLIGYLKFHYDIPIFCGGAGATLDFIKIYGANITFVGGVGHLGILNNISDFEETITYDQFTLDKYKGNLNFDGILDKYSPDAYGHVFSSVGCYANCRFCASPAIWHRKVYFKPIEAFLNELEAIALKYKPNKFTIWDENFTASTHRLKTFCKSYRLGIPWSADSRIDTLDEDKIILIKESGCFQVNVGVESGCQKTLDYLNKGIDKDRISQTLGLLRYHGLKSKVYMIMGFPGETFEDMKESVDFILSCQPSMVTLSLFTPYKNTSLYDECITAGIIDKDYNESDYSHQSLNFMRKTHPGIDISNLIRGIDDYNKANA